MKKNIIIFDFDGTIADTHHYIIEISNRLAEEFNFNKISFGEIEGLKDKTAAEMINFLKVPMLKIPAILAKGKKEFHTGLNTIKPIAGMHEALHQLKRACVEIGVLSSNSMENVTKFLAHHDLNIFDFIHTTSKIWSKNTSLDSLIKEKGYGREHIIYVGDETRDISAGRKLGVRVAAVGWGYNSIKTLQKHHPDFLIHNPQELLVLIDALQ